jgi:hypothetical protein
MTIRSVQLFGYLFAYLYFGIKIIPNPNHETENKCQVQLGTKLVSIDFFVTPVKRTSRAVFVAGFYLSSKFLATGTIVHSLFQITYSLLHVMFHSSEISSLLICHVHVRPHTRNSLYGCDPEINNSKLRTGSREYSDNNSYEVLTDQHTSVAHTCSHGDNKMSKCLTRLSVCR